MSQSHQPVTKRGSVALPATAIWAMAMAMGWVLQVAGGVAGFDALVRGWMAPLEDGLAAQPVPLAVAMTATALWVMGLVWAMMDSPGLWRRLVLWVTALVLTAAATPVGMLGGWWIAPGVTLVAVLWAGICAVVYTTRHQMPCEHKRPGSEAD